ncbi:MAG TPA: hypothetical protein VGV09_06645 [Steroidobacteraceae bacterium]|nr:hypothetical protein [Steroidobacteraceae bacterium]
MRRLVLLMLCAAMAVAQAFAAPPHWTGLWETESAERLLKSGAPDFEPPKLWGKPPYNAEWAQKVAAAHPPGAPPAAAELQLPPTTKVCAPTGFPAIMEYGVPDFLFEILITPAETLLLATDGAARHIYTDGRPHPAPADLWPTSLGDSIGHWEGRTLVIDTIARIAGPVGPVPWAANLSDRAHFTERLHLIDVDTLRDDMTIDDPARFSHPWRLTMRYQRVKDISRMIAINCAENDRNPVVNGKIVIAPPEH